MEGKNLEIVLCYFDLARSKQHNNISDFSTVIYILYRKQTKLDSFVRIIRFLWFVKNRKTFHVQREWTPGHQRNDSRLFRRNEFSVFLLWIPFGRVLHLVQPSSVSLLFSCPKLSRIARILRLNAQLWNEIQDNHVYCSVDRNELINEKIFHPLLH